MRTKRKLLLLIALGVPQAFAGDEASKQPVEVSHTERVNFAPGGLIHVLHSFGNLNVEGWDRSEVEITVVKSRERYYGPKEREEALQQIGRDLPANYRDVIEQYFKRLASEENE